MLGRLLDTARATAASFSADPTSTAEPSAAPELEQKPNYDSVLALRELLTIYEAEKEKNPNSAFLPVLMKKIAFACIQISELELKKYYLKRLIEIISDPVLIKKAVLDSRDSVDKNELAKTVRRKLPAAERSKFTNLDSVPAEALIESFTVDTLDSIQRDRILSHFKGDKAIIFSWHQEILVDGILFTAQADAFVVSYDVVTNIAMHQIWHDDYLMTHLKHSLPEIKGVFEGAFSECLRDIGLAMDLINPIKGWKFQPEFIAAAKEQLEKLSQQSDIPSSESKIKLQADLTAALSCSVDELPPCFDVFCPQDQSHMLRARANEEFLLTNPVLLPPASEDEDDGEQVFSLAKNNWLFSSSNDDGFVGRHPQLHFGGKKFTGTQRGTEKEFIIGQLYSPSDQSDLDPEQLYQTLSRQYSDSLTTVFTKCMRATVANCHDASGRTYELMDPKHSRFNLYRDEKGIIHFHAIISDYSVRVTESMGADEFHELPLPGTLVYEFFLASDGFKLRKLACDNALVRDLCFDNTIIGLKEGIAYAHAVDCSAEIAHLERQQKKRKPLRENELEDALKAMRDLKEVSATPTLSFRERHPLLFIFLVTLGALFALTLILTVLSLIPGIGPVFTPVLGTLLGHIAEAFGLTWMLDAATAGIASAFASLGGLGLIISVETALNALAAAIFGLIAMPVFSGIAAGIKAFVSSSGTKSVATTSELTLDGSGIVTTDMKLLARDDFRPVPLENSAKKLVTKSGDSDELGSSEEDGVVPLMDMDEHSLRRASPTRL